jgi:hypothetical protein
MAVLVLVSTNADTLCCRGLGLTIPPLGEKRKLDPVDAGVFRDKRALTLLALFQEQTTTRRSALFILLLTKLACTCTDDGVLIRMIVVVTVSRLSMIDIMRDEENDSSLPSQFFDSVLVLVIGISSSPVFVFASTGTKQERIGMRMLTW